MADEIIIVSEGSTEVINEKTPSTEILDTSDKYTIEFLSEDVAIDDTRNETTIFEKAVDTEISTDINSEVVEVYEKCSSSANGQPITYTNAEPTPSTVGGISSGSTFDRVALIDMWTDLLYPFQSPSFSSFTFTGRTPILEVGDTLTGGNKTFTWSLNNGENIVADSISISSTTGGVLASNLADDGTEIINIGNNITKNSLYTEVFTIRADSSQGGQISRTVSTSWRWRVFWGESENETLTENEIEALVSNSLKNSRSGTYSVSNPGYKFVAWPVLFGSFATMKDPDTNQDVAVNLPETISITNAHGVTQDYYLYRTTYYQNGALTMVVT